VPIRATISSRGVARCAPSPRADLPQPFRLPNAANAAAPSERPNSEAIEVAEPTAEKPNIRLNDLADAEIQCLISECPNVDLAMDAAPQETQTMTELQTTLEAKSKDELNCIAKKLRIKGYRKLTKTELIRSILSNDLKSVARSLSISWWDRYHNHVYGLGGLVVGTFGIFIAIVSYLVQAPSVTPQPRGVVSRTNGSPRSESHGNANRANGAESSPAPLHSPLTLEEFFDQQNQLEGRFAELEAFQNSLEGRIVRWRGYVHFIEGDKNVELRIRVQNDGTSTSGAYASFDESWSSKLYSLQKGDYVETEGTFEHGGPIYATIRGTNLRVLKVVARGN
jgi:hypothetical protein